jgi:hypothetical protein
VGYILERLIREVEEGEEDHRMESQSPKLEETINYLISHQIVI